MFNYVVSIYSFIIIFVNNYTITIGIFRDGARVSTDYAVANFFHFTVDTDTATIGGVKGGGVGCSVGPVTLSS